MNTLSDSIKRLRELYVRSGGNSMLTSHQFKDALQTISQLVELVAEIRDTLVGASYGGWNTDNDKVITKADALLSGLK